MNRYDEIVMIELSKWILEKIEDSPIVSAKEILSEFSKILCNMAEKE